MATKGLNIARMEQELLGDSNTTSLATSALSELLSAGGQLASGFQKQKETTAATAKAASDQQAKLQVAQQAASMAQSLRTAATLAAAKAKGEVDPNGPLHLAAIQADLTATTAEKSAQNLAAQAGQAYTPATGAMTASTAVTKSTSHSFLTRQAGPMKVWEWGLTTLIGITVIGGIVVAVRRK